MPFSGVSGSPDERGPVGGGADNNADIPELLRSYSNEAQPNQSTTKVQALLLILAYVVTAGLSWTRVDGLLQLLNALLGEKTLPNSKYMFRKLWKYSCEDAVQFCYFCTDCRELVGKSPSRTVNQKMTCTRCNKLYESQSLIAGRTFFILFDMKRQIEQILKQHSAALFERLQAIRDSITTCYSDITDGDLYREARRKLQCMWSDLTASFSTDGNAVFKSSKAAIWPIHVVINELPVIARWRNVITGGF